MLEAASFFTGWVLIAVGLVAVVFVDNIIKKVMGAFFITDGVNLLLVTLGYRPGGVIPIVVDNIIDTGAFASVAGYPLPQALVLTNIVIGAATTAVMLGLVIKLYQRYNSLSASEILGGDGDD